jgi:hypothetical protein
MSEARSSRPLSGGDIVLRVAIVALALSTAWIHLNLGGLRFTLNAAGYVALSIAMIAPIPLAVRYRWLTRLALAGYAATTIVAWAVEGPYYSTAYVAKAIELTLIALLVIDIARRDGNPVERLRHEVRTLMT